MLIGRRRRKGNGSHRNHHKQLRLSIILHWPQRIAPRNKVLRPTRHSRIPRLRELVPVFPREETEKTGRDRTGDDEVAFGEFDAAVLFTADVGGL
jgi:hypothetical protein